MKYRVVEEISGDPLIEQELSFEGDTTKARRDAAEAECRRLNANQDLLQIVRRVADWCETKWPTYPGVLFVGDVLSVMRQIGDAKDIYKGTSLDPPFG